MREEEPSPDVAGHQGVINLIVIWLCGLVAFALGGVWMLFALLAYGRQCGERCSQAEQAWVRDQEAWQWIGQLGFALLGSIALGLAVVCIAKRAWAAAVICLIAVAALFVLWEDIARHSIVGPIL